MIKKSEIEKALAGVDPRARALVAGAGAPLRHAARVDETFRVAVDAARELKNDYELATYLVAWALLTLDLNGIGGHASAGCLGGQSCGTARRPEFKSLGKGRWQASDGGAWRADAEGAVQRLLEGFAQKPWLEPIDGALNAVMYGPDGRTISVPLPHDSWTASWATGQLLELGKVTEPEALDTEWLEDCRGWSSVAFPPEDTAVVEGRAWAERRAASLGEASGEWNPVATDVDISNDGYIIPVPNDESAAEWIERCCQAAAARWKELIGASEES